MAKLSPEQAAKNRERQRRWREKAFNPEGYGLNRVNVALDTHAAEALKRLTAGYGLTQRELIERLLSAADSEIAETISHERRAAYLDGKLEPGALGAFDLTVRRETLADTPALSLEPSAKPPKPRTYPDWLKARAVAMHKAGEPREAITAMLIAEWGDAPDVTNWSKTLRRWIARTGKGE